MISSYHSVSLSINSPLVLQLTKHPLVPDFLASFCSAYILRDNFERRYFSFPYQFDTFAPFLTTRTPGEKPTSRTKRSMSSSRFTITPSALNLEPIASVDRKGNVWLLNPHLVISSDGEISEGATKSCLKFSLNVRVGYGGLITIDPSWDLGTMSSGARFVADHFLIGSSWGLILKSENRVPPLNSQTRRVWPVSK